MTDVNQEVLDQDGVGQAEIVKVPSETGADTTVEETQPVEQEKPAEKSEEPKQPVKERPVYTMPVAKAQEEKRIAVEKAKAEAQAQAQAEMERIKAEYEAKLQSNRTPSDLDKKLEEVAEEHGLDKDAAKKLLDVFKESIQLPDMSRYDSLVKEVEEKKIKSEVQSWISEKVVPLIKTDNPNATPDQIADIAKVVEELAFSEEYKGYRLEDIYRVKRDELTPKSGFSVEGSRGRAPAMVDFSNMSDEDENNLAENDPETFKKYLDYRKSKGSRYLN